MIVAAGGYDSAGGRIIGAISGLVSIALLIPGITLGIRRLHDISKSGWSYLVILVPLVGWIILLIWFCRDSDPGDNQYGSNPKGFKSATADGPIARQVSFAASAPVTVKTTEKQFYERDNMGTRQESMSQAMSYWMNIIILG